MRILCVGNSFSINSAQYLGDIAKAAHRRAKIEQCSIGGCPLEKHWRNVTLCETAPDSEAAKAYDGMTILEKLTQNRWDFITIQQYSMYSFKPETYQPFGKQLYEYIRKHAPQAEVLVHETWAYRADDPIYVDGFTPDKMYQDLRKAYIDFAAELGCRILPVGDAFHNAQRDSDWGDPFAGLKFNAVQTVHPALPDQSHSLHVGHHWKKDDATGDWKLHYDGHHAGPAGCYLAAAVWYEMMFNRSVVGNKFMPDGMKAEDVATLQRIAHETIVKNAQPTARPAANK